MPDLDGGPSVDVDMDAERARWRAKHNAEQAARIEAARNRPSPPPLDPWPFPKSGDQRRDAAERQKVVDQPKRLGPQQAVRLTPEQAERVRQFVREALTRDPGAAGDAVRRRVNTQLGLALKDKTFRRKYWNPITDEMGIKRAGLARATLTEEEAVKYQAFAREKLKADPDVSGYRVWCDTVPVFDPEISQSTWYKRIWKPVIAEIGIEMKPQVAPYKRGRQTEEPKAQTPAPEPETGAAARQSDPSGENPQTDHAIDRAPQPTEWRQWRGQRGTEGRVEARQRRSDRRWRVVVEAWLDEEPALAILNMLEPVLDRDEPTPDR